MNRPPFASEEWYHCYTRGVEKRLTFMEPADFARFQETMYLANNRTVRQRSDYKDPEHVFLQKQEHPLVHIGAYCLMNNHFHILLQAEDPKDVSAFMRKLGTSYAMYFNKKYERVGNLFVKPFRSRHIADDRYLRQVVSYIHLNPIRLEALMRSPKDELVSNAQSYRWCSLNDYESNFIRNEAQILSEEKREFIKEVSRSIEDAMREAAEYQAEMSR